MQTALDAALAYASRGWFVFPVQAAPNKRPLTDNGYHDATTDHATIVEWWSRMPSAQVGIDCGRSGIVSLDIDNKPEEGVDGHLSFDELHSEHGPSGCGLEMKTPRGTGVQLFFADPERRCRRKLAVRPGIDVLGDGGYTIVPSPSSPGREWKAGDPFDPFDLCEAPDWLLELGSADRAPRAPSVPMESARAIRLSDGEVAEIRHALTFIDNWDRGTWLKVGFALKSTGAGDQAFGLWDEWSKRTPDGNPHPKYDGKDQRRTWAAAKEFFLDGSEVSMASVWKMARDRGYEGEGGEEAPAPVQINLGLAPLPPVEPETARPIVSLDDPLPKVGGEFNLADWQDVAELPPIEWQIEGVLPRESLCVLGGYSEAGKSFAMIDMALHVVHGLPWCGHELEAGSVLYLCGEGQGGFGARLRAWKAHNGHRIEGADTGCYMLVSNAIPALGPKSAATLHQLIQTVARGKGHPPALVVVDTLSQGLQGEEKNEVLAPILTILAALRNRWRCSFVLVHHLVKPERAKRGGEAARPTREDIRGGGAIVNNVDTVLGLTTDKGGLRELFVWKQKDGEKPSQQIRLRLEVVETGRFRAKGKPESSCVIIPEVEIAVGDGMDGSRADRDPENEVEETIAKVVEVLREQGAVPGGRGAMTKSELTFRVGGRKVTAAAAIEAALRAGAIQNVGTASRWSLVATP